MFKVTETWRATYPGVHAGFLVMQGVANPARHPGLEAAKQALEERLRTQFAGQDRHALEAYGPIPAYTTYYRQFEKTYHVLAQLASIVYKGKPIPSVAALVEAMFMAEIKNGLLTAGHDLDLLQPPVTLDVAGGEERYTLLRGQAQGCKAGDMLMADQAGVISSIVYGPDERTQITAANATRPFCRVCAGRDRRRSSAGPSAGHSGLRADRGSRSSGADDAGYSGGNAGRSQRSSATGVRGATRLPRCGNGWRSPCPCMKVDVLSRLPHRSAWACGRACWPLHWTTS